MILLGKKSKECLCYADWVNSFLGGLVMEIKPEVKKTKEDDREDIYQAAIEELWNTTQDFIDKIDKTNKLLSEYLKGEGA